MAFNPILCSYSGLLIMPKKKKKKKICKGRVKNLKIAWRSCALIRHMGITERNQLQ